MTTPTPQRWTPHVEALIAKAMLDELYRQDANDDEVSVGWYVARAALTALADAGLLLPPGGERYDQYKVGDADCCVLTGGSDNFIHSRPERRHTHVRQLIEWADGSGYTAPWRETPDA